MANVANAIVNEIDNADLSFSEIAEKYNVPYSYVVDIYEAILADDEF